MKSEEDLLKALEKAHIRKEKLHEIGKVLADYAKKTGLTAWELSKLSFKLAVGKE